MSYSSGLHLPPLRGTNKLIIIILVGIFLLTSILSAAGVNLAHVFSLSGHTALKGHIYQFFTYPFYTHSLLEIIFHSMIFWFLGDELEQLWGKKKYITFLVSVFLITGFFYSIIEFSSGVFAPLSGVNGLVSSLCLAYAILFPDRIFSFMMLFPVKAKYFCMILIGMSVFNLFLSARKMEAMGHLMALGVAFATMMWMSRSKKLNAPALKKKKANHLKLVKDEADEKTPKYWQ